MQEYASKQDLAGMIKKTSEQFIQEFTGIPEADKDIRIAGIERTPQEMIAYQLGWMELLQGWDRDELEGKPVVTPAPGYKWNQMGQLYQEFYKKYEDASLAELQTEFTKAVDGLVAWLEGFEDEELFQAGGRKWASSVPSNWPIWRWVHTNTVAPFQTFRTKIRKWKKLRAASGES